VPDVVGQPLWARRLISLGGGASALALLWAAFQAPSSGYTVAMLLLDAGWVAAVVRIARLGVVLRDDSLTIRGLLASRTIPRAAISNVRRDGPVSIEWRDEAGVPRESVLYAFSSNPTPRGDSPAERFARASLDRIERWVDATASAAASED
jgi:hypothetical protein